MKNPTEQKIDLIMKLAAGLHTYGATAHGLESAMGNVVASQGMTGQFFATPTVIMAAFETSEGRRNALVRVKPGGIDLEKMLELDKIGDDLILGLITLEQADSQLDEIINHPSPYSALTEALAYVLIGASVVVFFSGGFYESLFAGVISLLVGILAVSVSFMPQTARFFEFLAAFIVSVVASMIYVFYPCFSIELVTLASLIVFVPGLSLTISMTELASENLAAGTARLMQAITVFMKLAFGVVLGTTLMKLAFPSISFVDQVIAPLPSYWIIPSLIVSAIGFTILFRAKPKNYGWILLAAILAFSVTYFSGNYLSTELAPFVGGFAVGLGANIYARLLKRPAAMIAMPGLILLVPGSIGFRGLSFLVEKNTLAGIETTFQMFMIAVALVGGLLLASILVPPKRSL
jgi:uncharacterized membrane protein YjjP (DUF1212 family)